jgi:hypothetical protein
MVPHSLANASQRRTRRQNSIGRVFHAARGGLVTARIPLPLQAAKSFAVDGLREKLREFFRKEVREEARAMSANHNSTVGLACHVHG